MVQAKKATSLASLRWLLLLPIPALWCVLSHFGALTFFENKLVDWRFRYRGEIPAPVKVAYVDIDSLSINTLGNFSWDRKYFARVASALINEGKAKAVGIDVVFSEEGMSELSDRRRLIAGNIEFGRFLFKQPPVVLAASYAGWSFTSINKDSVKFRALPIVATTKRKIEEMEPPEVPAFQTSPDPEKPRLYSPPFVGLIDTLNGDTREVPAWAPNNTSRTYYHMAFELARIYWGLPPGSLKVVGDHLDFVQPDGGIKASAPLRLGQFIEINWFSHWESDLSPHWEFSTVWKLAEALNSDDAEAKKTAKDFFAQDELKDAIVLIGPVDPLLQDIAPTSFDETPVPKVGVHGNLVKTIVSGLYLHRFPRAYGVAWWDFAVAFGLTLIVVTLALAGGARALFAKIMAVLAIAIYVALAFQLFKSTQWILPLTAPLGSALTTSFAGLIWQVIEEQKAKGRIKGMFGTYISPQLVEQMVESGEDPQLGGHVGEITAYFSDIQSFSSFSELLSPERLVDLMNEYLTACTDIVTAQGGTLDKYIGDAVVAMFGAPIPLDDHAYRACVATQLVHLKLGELRAKWTAEGDKWPDIVKRMQSRIGINSGEATIGNMGSTTRFNYTMMGDNVNLAARMESGAKSWGAYTMCTEATKVACEKHGDRIVFRPLSRLVVKGRKQAVPVYEIVGLKENVSQQTRDCIGVFEQALAKYYARDWDAALKLFAQSRELEFNVPGKTPGVVSNPSIVYLEKVVPERIEEPPPTDWDGRYEMKEK